MNTKIIVCCLLLLVSTGLVWAGGGLQGTVRDSRGDPIKGAEIRIERRDGNVLKIIKTDATGHYFSDDLAIGTDYRLTLVVNGSIKASLLNVRTAADKPVELSFYIRPGNRSSNKHMVWVPDQPVGTHVGAGHWAELDENGRLIERNDLDVVVMGREYARQLEMSGTRPML
jgi:Carboxypeptidase regulatory-like domain